MLMHALNLMLVWQLSIFVIQVSKILYHWESRINAMERLHIKHHHRIKRSRGTLHRSSRDLHRSVDRFCGGKKSNASEIRNMVISVLASSVKSPYQGSHQCKYSSYHIYTRIIQNSFADSIICHKYNKLWWSFNVLMMWETLFLRRHV